MSRSAAAASARHFLHPDGSFAGEYGSRGTSHFYPHGMELLAAVSAEAADLVDGANAGPSHARLLQRRSAVCPMPGQPDRAYSTGRYAGKYA